MSPGTSDDQYLAWLYSQVAEVRSRKSSKTYWDLLRLMYKTEFTWFVPNDGNRADDGRDLRREWCESLDEVVDGEWLSLGCSFLEMLIGVSRRLEFEAEGDARDWFWHLINNMGLLGYHDRSNFSEDDVVAALDRVIWRNYDDCGNGGLFPLRETDRDQREVEIWYQLCEYLLQDA